MTPASDGRSAVLRVRTSLEMACAVVYGETEELGGGLATDTDMQGGAHTDHEATMLGLEPETEYVYRVQGSGVGGALYQSELMSFRTPAASEPPRENVAVGAQVVEVSSTFSEQFAAQNAVDGDPATAWSTAGDGTSIIERYTLTVDDRTFGPFEAGEGLTVAATSFTGRVLRFDAVETTGGNTGAVEIEVYR